jgi:spore coat protein B
MSKESMLTNLEMSKGKVIKVDRGGPESRTGLLLDVSSDYFTILTEQDGVVYYRVQHCKSITENVKNTLKINAEVTEELELVDGGNFMELVRNMKYRWVRINRGGPEKVEGVVESVTEDFLVLVSNNEVIRLSMYHIRNISLGVPENKNEDNQNNNENQTKDNKSESKQSSQYKKSSSSKNKNTETEKTLTLEGDTVKK